MPNIGPVGSSATKAPSAAERKQREAAARGRLESDIQQRNQLGFGFNAGLGPSAADRRNPDYVRAVQRELNRVGLKVAVDGIWGPQTEQAYRAYSQRINTKGGLNLSAGSYARLQQEYARKIQAQIRAAEERYKGMLKALEAEPVGVRGLAIAQFWAGLGSTYAGGAFAQQAKKSAAILKDYEGAVKKYGDEQAAQSKRGPMGFLGRVASRLNPGGTVGQILSGAIDLIEEPWEALVARPSYLAQFRQNQRIRKGQGYVSNQDQQVFDFIAGIAASNPLTRGLIKPSQQAAYDAINTRDERDALTKAGYLESMGQRAERDFVAFVVGQWGSPQDKARLQKARSFQTALPGWKPSWVSAAADFGFNMVDPTLVGRPLRRAGMVADALSAERLLTKSPGIVDSLTSRVAAAAGRAAARDVEGLAGVGDVRLLQQLVPSLRRTGAATELSAALAATRPERALAYLGKLENAADQSTAAGRLFHARVGAAISKVKDLGMVDESRKAILEASLGRVWKPTINLGARATGAVLQKTVGGRGLSAMPVLTRQAKLTSLADLMSRATKGGKQTNLGMLVRDPETGNLLRFAKRSAEEKKAATAYLGRLNTKDFRVDAEMAGLAARIEALPDGPFKDIMAERQGVIVDTLESLVGDVEIPPAFKDLDKGLKKEIRQLNKEVVGFQELKPITYERAVYNFQAEVRDYAYMMGKAPAARVSPWTRARRAVFRTFDTVPKAVVNLHDVNERARAFHDYALALGLSEGDARQAFARMASTQDSNEALKLAEEMTDGMVRSFLVQEGLDDAQVAEVWGHVKRNANDFWRDQEGWFSVVDQRSSRFKTKYDKVYDAKGAKDAQVLSQMQYNYHMVDPQDLRRYVIEYKRKAGSQGAALRNGAYAATLGLYQAYLPIHHWFKFLALTLAAPRYVLRVAAMEERLRMWMTHGFVAHTEVSSKHVRRLNNQMLDASHGARWFTGWEHVGIENMPMHLMDRKMIQVTGHGLIDKGGRGFVENLWHVLMFQVRPEDDLLHHLLMPHLWDPEALKAAKESAIEALETTERGRVYLEKAIQVNRELRDSKKLVDRVEKWLKQVMPNQAVVAKRLGGQFPMRELARREEWWPEKIWGDKYTSLWQPRNPVNMFRDIAGRATIQAPTTHLNRLPFAWAEFNREFDALTAAGFKAEAARDMASDWAVKRTNDILFDASVRSRFAQKFDIFFPFQQAREEVVRVWSRLLREEPERAAKLMRLAATLFNAGKSEGMIVQNQYGGWEMRVPGSPELSRALGRYAPDWVPFKRGFQQTAESGFRFDLRNLLFVNDVWGTTPRPGGPWWVTTGNLAVQTHPEWFPRSGFLQKYLFDERNPTTMFLRPEVTRLWIAATGKTFVPWEPLASFGWGGRESYTESVRDRLVGEVGAELYRQWIKAGGDPKDKPTSEDIANAVRAQLFMWGIAGMVVPASTRVTVQGREDYDELVKAYTKNGKLDFAALADAHPEMVGFYTRHSKDAVRERYTDDQGNVDVERLKRENPEYWRRWKAKGSPYDDGPEGLVDAIYRAKDYLSPEEFTDAVDDSMRVSEAWDKFHLIINGGGNYSEKVEDIALWQKEYGDIDEAHGKQMRDYRRDLELDKIMRLPPSIRDDAIKNWQFRYDVSMQQTQNLIAEYGKGLKDHHNPWMETRNTIDLAVEFRRNKEGLSATKWGEKYLTPAERVNFYKYMTGQVTDIQDFNEIWAALKSTEHEHGDELYNNRYAKQLDDIKKSAEDYFNEKRADVGTAIYKKYQQIANITKLQQDIIKQANATKDYKARGALWAQYFALKDRKNKLYAEIRGAQNSLYRSVPNLARDADEIRYHELIQQHGAKAVAEAGLDHWGVPYFLDSQEKKWQQMPARIQQDYVDDLVERLTVQPGRYVTERGEAALKWDYLTEFQKDILRTQLDGRKLDMVRRMAAIHEEYESGGKGRRGFGRGRWRIDGFTLGNGFGELAFAFEQFKRYNQRGDMPEPTAQLKEYMRLGDNTILKAAYLKEHPELREWLKAGPMANMPPVLAEVVRNIMVKYGKWESDEDVLSWDEIAEIGFAKTILARYNRRGSDTPPPAYELWLKMPTGKKRFDYMRAHPEIERWLQRGPMANMPPEYQDVVRDIMGRYGLWEKRTDPLSVLLEEYFQVPDIAKQRFLEQHPEILAYWRAIRTGEDRALFDLAQSYFAIADQDGKRAFLAAHPELQQYFVDERRRRYESFLNNVARYLGRTPELADAYLSAQTVYIRQMLDMFGQAPLVPYSVTAVYSRTQRGQEGNVVRTRST